MEIRNMKNENKKNHYYHTYYQVRMSTAQYYYEKDGCWDKADEYIKEYNEKSEYPLSDFTTPITRYYRKSDITKYLKKIYSETYGRVEPVKIELIGLEMDWDKCDDIEHTLGTWVVEPKQYGMWFDNCKIN